MSTAEYNRIRRTAIRAGYKLACTRRAFNDGNTRIEALFALTVNGVIEVGGDGMTLTEIEDALK